MAPKRILEDPPAASSMEEEEDSDPTEGDEEEEEDVVGEEEDDEEEEEEENVNEKKGNPKPVAPVSIAKPESSSDDEDDDGSETESDDDSGIGDFTVKPIVSKPNNTTTDSAKPSAKKPSVATPTKAPKRAAETDLASKGSKKKKKGSGGDDEDTRKGRLWSEEDEIAILKGMIDYKAKKGLDPSANLGPFHEFLKKTLKVDVSKNQLADKMRRLKKKYLTNADKSENGEDPVFSKAHETKSFDLSKKIWGVEVNGADDSAKNSKKKKKPRKTANANANAKGNNSATVLALPVSDASEKKVEVEKKVELNVANGGGVKAELEDFSVKYPHLSGSLKGGLSEGVDSFIFQNLPALGSSKVKDLDAKWKKLQLLELDLAVGKLDLMHEQSKLVMDAVKSWKD